MTNHTEVNHEGESINKRKLGTDKEELAARYLKERGVKMLEKNFRCRQGEIDLIYRDGEYLVFCEVKYRSNNKNGTAMDAVGITKQRKICRVAEYYRMIHHLGDLTPIRYDVMARQGDQVTWIRNAFQHQKGRASYAR